MELTKLSKQDEAKLKVLGWANVYCQLKDENEKKWKRRVIKFGIADKLKAQAFFFSGPTEHQPKGRIDLLDLVEVYVEGEMLFVQTSFSLWHIDPEGKNLDKKILEMWFQQFTAPMNELPEQLKIDSKKTIGHHYFDQDPQGITNFCWEYCEGVDQFQMIKWVNKGAHVAHTIYSKPENEWKPLSCKTPSTQAQVVALIWLLTAKSASYSELFTGGVFRVDDQEGKLFKFLNSCEPFVYKRISSHYPERADETYKLHGPQRGIDISEPEVKLPTSKKTILFFRLADLSTVIKIEAAGCPPFWEKDFRTFKNAMEFGKHSTDFLTVTLAGPNKGMKVRRAEQFSNDQLDTFAMALDLLYPQSSFKALERSKQLASMGLEEDKLEQEEKERNKNGEGEGDYCDLKKHIFKLGCRAGLTLMIKLLERHDPKFTKPPRTKSGAPEKGNANLSSASSSFSPLISSSSTSTHKNDGITLPVELTQAELNQQPHNVIVLSKPFPSRQNRSLSALHPAFEHVLDKVVDPFASGLNDAQREEESMLSFKNSPSVTKLKNADSTVSLEFKSGSKSKLAAKKGQPVKTKSGQLDSKRGAIDSSEGSLKHYESSRSIHSSGGSGNASNVNQSQSSCMLAGGGTPLMPHDNHRHQHSGGLMPDFAQMSRSTGVQRDGSSHSPGMTTSDSTTQSTNDDVSLPMRSAPLTSQSPSNAPQRPHSNSVAIVHVSLRDEMAHPKERLNGSGSMSSTENAVHVYEDPLAAQLASPISNSDIESFSKIYTPSNVTIGQELAEASARPPDRPRSSPKELPFTRAPSVTNKGLQTTSGGPPPRPKADLPTMITPPTKEASKRGLDVKKSSAGPNDKDKMKQRDQVTALAALEAGGFLAPDRRVLRTDFDSLAAYVKYVLGIITSTESFVEPAKLNFPKIATQIADLRKIVELDIRRGYRGARRGMECCLPDIATWPELQAEFEKLDFGGI